MGILWVSNAYNSHKFYAYGNLWESGFPYTHTPKPTQEPGRALKFLHPDCLTPQTISTPYLSFADNAHKNAVFALCCDITWCSVNVPLSRKGPSEISYTLKKIPTVVTYSSAKSCGYTVHICSILCCPSITSCLMLLVLALHWVCEFRSFDISVHNDPIQSQSKTDSNPSQAITQLCRFMLCIFRHGL